MSLYDQLKLALNHPSVRARTLSAAGAAEAVNKVLSTGIHAQVGVDQKTAERYVQEITAWIQNVVYSAFPSSKARAGGSNFCQVHFDGLDGAGTYQYSVTFHPLAIARESLYQKGYPNGLQNVAALFSHGSKPSSHAVWGRDERSKKHYFIPKGYVTRPESFLRDAIEEINAEYAKYHVKVTLDRKYEP